ncbi:LysR family transcriptional regulator [Lonepinella koalarum]|uniref:DNA-binding transcriptional LysR family regulator n=1 Tax=Lonepinella koalarum TaxID=53417 RepID=A0A4V2PU97_9PAST|nr:LysR family transcriptional regulator [Lonepinella koalarum]MDH2926543.1 hypothetical protein [Lonepinella koalarum]TCK69521.1 DNA-binding transcriptional LysR family regulator [Lonepinella koalarum]TFJ89766.1 LysR family transcriptional regulator [Lonepinella koalarum]TYG34038.1 LysR family transcriptional regulator [Lonepinella koalarum]
MDIKRLKYFCTILECGSITKAAEILHISQPPLSKRLQELEEEIGVPLFIRQNGKLQATETGLFLYKQAVELLTHFTQVEQDILHLSQQNRQCLQIGLTHLFQEYFTPLILQWQARSSNLKIDVMVSDSDHLEYLLQQKIIDIAFMQKPENMQGYDYIACPSTALVAVVHNDLISPVAQLHLTDLAKLPLILLKRSGGRGTSALLLDKLRKNGIEPNVLMQVSQPSVTIDWIESGIKAAALLPISEVENLTLSNCHILPVTPDPQLFFPCVVRLSTTPMPPILADLLADGYQP